jgi:hypothetical protein
MNQKEILVEVRFNGLSTVDCCPLTIIRRDADSFSTTEPVADNPLILLILFEFIHDV